MAAVQKQKRGRAGSITTGGRVTGLALRAALQTAAEKQMSAMGYRIITGFVTFQGDKAFAQWQPRSMTYVTVKGQASYIGRSYRINYPAFSGDAVFTRAEADLIAAFTLHESSHVMFSEIGVWPIYQAISPRWQTCPRVAAWLGIDPNINHNAAKDIKSGLFKVWNGMEDARIEQTLIVSGAAAGAKQLFARLLNKLTNDISADFNPCKSGSLPLTLAVLGREALGNGNIYSSRLLGRIPEPKRALFAWYMEQIKQVPLGYDKEAAMWVLAADFMERFLELNAPPPVADQPPPPDGKKPPEQDDEYYDDDGTDETNDDDDEFDDRDDDEPPAGSEPEDDYEQVDLGPDEEPGQPGDGEPGDDESDEGEDGGDEPAVEPPINPSDGPADGGPADGDDGEPEDGDGGDSDSGEPADEPADEGSTPGRGKGDEAYDDTSEAGDPVDSEPSVDDIFGAVNNRTRSPGNEKLRSFDRCTVSSYAQTLAIVLRKS